MLYRFLIAHGAGAFATGIHVVLLAWLSVSQLNLSAASLGWVQAAGLVPNLFFMLIAGAWADRKNPAMLLASAFALHAICFFILAILIHSQLLTFPLLVSYAVLVGIGNAFCQPVREKLMTEIERHSMQKRVSLVSITQFSLQSLGIVFASSSDTIGVFHVVLIQGVVATLAVIVTLTLVQKNHQATKPTTNIVRDIKRGLKLVQSSQPLKQLMVLIAFNGYMHMGVFIVLLPIIATKVYSFNSAQYGSLQLVFVLGMITAHFSLLRQKIIEYPGQGALFSLLYTAVIGFALSKFPTVFGLYALIFCWGLVAGNSSGRSRLVLQALVDRDMKGRAISIYQLMLFGAAPFGALVTGYILHYLEIQDILEFMSLSSIGLFALFLLSRSLWSVKQESVQEISESD